MPTSITHSKERLLAPALAAQRAYVQDTAVTRHHFGLLVPEAFVRGIRDIGYRSNGDAIAELIDNALQAYADRIDLLFGYDGTLSSKKPSQVAVLDNGHGMEPAMMRLAVMWGGTHREDDRNGLGRYGYGLPCAGVSLGRRFSVLSKVPGGRLYGITLDLDDVTAGKYTNNRGEIVIPPARLAKLPDFVSEAVETNFPDGWDSGTVVLIEKLDRLQWSTSQGLRENLCRQFGVTYHKLRGAADLFVDGEFVEPVDPLFLTAGFHLYDLDADKAQRFDLMKVKVRDPDDGSYRGTISLRYAWLPPSFGSIDKARDAAGLNANARFSVLKEYHGLIFSRNGRLIDVHTRTPWTSFINNDRYIKVEVEFPATLDEYFGVTTSKQQVTVSPYIWDVLRQAGLPKAVEQLRAKVREAKLAIRTNNLAAAAEGLRTTNRVTDASAGGAELLPTEHHSDTRIRTAPYRLAFWHEPGGDFFRVKKSKRLQTLHINSAHRFFNMIYDSPQSNPEQRVGLELLLLCIGDITHDLPQAHRSQHLAHLSAWSSRLEEALTQRANQT